jgi:ankyrin repeat protein
MDINTRALVDGHTALTISVAHNIDASGDLLLELGADPNVLGHADKLALGWAVGNPKYSKQLLASGADLTRVPNILLRAVQTKKIDSVRLLLEHGADVHCRDTESNFALHEATKMNQVDIAELLASRGADPNMACSGSWAGWTPLMQACRIGSMDMVKLLMKHKADVNAMTKDSRTPIDIAAAEGHDEILVLLLDGGEE